MVNPYVLSEVGRLLVEGRITSKRLQNVQICPQIVQIEKKKLKSWKKDNFGIVSKRRLVLELEMAQSEVTLQTYHNEALLKQEQILLNQPDEIYLQEESFWKQTSHLQWLKEGDRNTKYFHLSTMASTLR